LPQDYNTIEVKDQNGSIFSTTASISNTNGPTAIATTPTDASCGSSNGTLTLGAVTGGASPYTYSVDGSAFTTTINYTGLCIRHPQHRCKKMPMAVPSQLPLLLIIQMARQLLLLLQQTPAADHVTEP
jgi:hypothetical protein